MYSLYPLKITYASIFSKECKILEDCLFSAKVNMYVYMALVLLEVIERNEWSVNLINVVPVVLKWNAMHTCQLHIYTVVIFLLLFWSALSSINVSALCDDSWA